MYADGHRSCPLCRQPWWFTEPWDEPSGTVEAVVPNIYVLDILNFLRMIGSQDAVLYSDTDSILINESRLPSQEEAARMIESEYDGGAAHDLVSTMYSRFHTAHNNGFTLHDPDETVLDGYGSPLDELRWEPEGDD